MVWWPTDGLAGAADAVPADDSRAPTAAAAARQASERRTGGRAGDERDMKTSADWGTDNLESGRWPAPRAVLSGGRPAVLNAGQRPGVGLAAARTRRNAPGTNSSR